MTMEDSLSWPDFVDISPNKDRKLLKKVIKEGGGTLPGPGLTVYVHYVGSLVDGTEFDRSDRNAAPFHFILGKGAVIKGWDEGIKTMKQGEKAKLVCTPDFAYGRKGTGTIPADATLIFEVEVLYWKEEDLTDKKDGGILRRKIVEGPIKYLSPNAGAIVTITLKATHLGKVFDEREVTFPIGEGSVFDIPYGVDKAMKFFEEKEKSVLTLAPKYGFGTDGFEKFGIPPEAILHYEIELKSFEKMKEAWQMDGNEKLEASRKFKEKGTQYFSQEKYHLALKQYKRIPDYLKAEAMLEGDEEVERKQLLLAGYLNYALCCIKIGNYPLAIRCCDESLVYDPGNSKGLYRRGMAYLGVLDPNLAKQDFLAVLNSEPKNKAVHHQLALCEKMIKEHLQEERSMFGRMFIHSQEQQ